MKSVIVILLILFFVITPAHALLSSDGTGLINRFEIQTSGHTFEIKLTSNFDLNDFVFDKNEKELTLYLESNLDNNLGEIIIPKNLLTGDFTFYLNDVEFFPKVQSNSLINFITLEFSGSGSNVVTIIGTEYLTGLTEIVINDPPPYVETESSSDSSFVWLILSGIVIVVLVCIVVKIKKNKN